MRAADLSHFPSDIAAGTVLRVIVGKISSERVAVEPRG
jgi:hypothetical protein